VSRNSRPGRVPQPLQGQRHRRASNPRAVRSSFWIRSFRWLRDRGRAAAVNELPHDTVKPIAVRRELVEFGLESL